MSRALRVGQANWMGRLGQRSGAARQPSRFSVAAPFVGRERSLLVQASRERVGSCARAVRASTRRRWLPRRAATRESAAGRDGTEGRRRAGPHGRGFRRPRSGGRSEPGLWTVPSRTTRTRSLLALCDAITPIRAVRRPWGSQHTGKAHFRACALCAGCTCRRRRQRQPQARWAAASARPSTATPR